MRTEQAIDLRLADAVDQWRIGQISAVAGNKITVSVAGTTRTINRLASWTPATGDVVVIAVTPAGWIALCKIA